MSIALLDIRVASYYSHEMNQLVLDRIAEVRTTSGIIVIPVAQKLSKCIRAHVLDSGRDILEQVTGYFL